MPGAGLSEGLLHWPDNGETPAVSLAPMISSTPTLPADPVAAQQQLQTDVTFRRRDLIRMSLRSRSLYPFVLAWFAQNPPSSRASMRVLDLPAGSGVISAPLRAAGFDVTPADLFPEYFEEAQSRLAGRGVIESFQEQGEATVPGWLRAALFGDRTTDPPRPTDQAAVHADMEATLPFDDASFDRIACIEGIEHMVDRHRTLKELRRVLKPDGSMLISTPNLLSLRARFAYALAGQRAFRSYVDEHTSVWGRSEDGARIYHGHAFLINYFQFRYSLHHCGLRISRLWPSNWSPSSLMLTPTIPLVWLATQRSQRKAKRKFARMQAAGEIPSDVIPPYDEMLRHLLATEMLFNAALVLEVRPA